jgi:4-hydroxy-tetrahydrodipicolinate reductase
MAKRRYRVVQWATGNIGLRSLRAVIEHPDLDLVGLYVYSDQKVGRDAGELCGLDPVGVRATNDMDEILALSPDCVLHMANTADIDVLCRLLESGANVVTTTGEFHYPPSMDPDRRKRFEQACQRGGASIHSTGSDPGYITERIPLAITSIVRRLDRLTIEEFADMSSRNSPEMIFMLFGHEPSESDLAPRRNARGGGYSPLRLVADAMSVPFEDVVTSRAVSVARHDVDIPAGRIKAGTIAGVRNETTGIRKGEAFMILRQSLFVTKDLDPQWDLPDRGPAGWRMIVEGDTPLDIRIDFPVAAEDWGATSPGLTAHPPVNAVSYVCEAAPGIVTTVDLPQVIATFG